MALSSIIYSWTGYAVIANFIDAAVSFWHQRMLPADLEAELSRLRAVLPQITVVMDVAEVLKIMHPNSGVVAWLEQFRLAFEAAEDVLDELNYQELSTNLVRDQGEAQGFGSSLKRKLTNFLRPDVKVDTLKRFRRASQMLDAAAASVGPLLQLATMTGVPGFSEPQHETGKIFYRETSSVMTECRVYGRDVESSKIINWLVQQEVTGKLSAFSIVGMGGIGKTTIAQIVCQHMSIKNHFEKIIWVYVSNKFSVKDITKKILEALGENSNGRESLDALQRSLKENLLAVTKVLIVLDDVWNDSKISYWEKLLAPLRCAHLRIKILVTTRMKSVGDMFASVHDVEHSFLTLEGLGEEQFLLLFNNYAFHSFNLDNNKDLQRIGKQIVEMLRGSPLAAKVIGRLLKSCMDHHYWGKVLKNICLNGLGEAEELMEVLKLSYFHLPANLQTCFRYCSLFPKDYIFDKNELIKMWIGSGLIQQSHKKEKPDDIGKEYFNVLVKKSFFLDCTDGEQYIMHDFIHDLARNVSEGECCRVQHNDKLDTIPSTVRHVSVPGSEIERIFHLKNLRTLIITDPCSYTFVLPADLIIRSLRLLSLVTFSQVVLPEEIGRLVHLRFIDIDLHEPDRALELLLLKSFSTLYQLQVLKLSYNYGTNYLYYDIYYSNRETTEISNMISLRHLELPGHLMETIHGVHKLTALQELSFWVGTQRGYIDELKTLKNLQHLSIFNIEKIGDPAEAKNIKLSEKRNLISLSLTWGVNNYSYSSEHSFEQTIDSLQPHPNLKELAIVCYDGERSPIWMKDSPPLDLSSLTLSDCPFWKDLPFVGQMRHLKILHLSRMDEVEEVDYSFDSTISVCAFPALKELHCSEMPSWESWGGPLSSYGLPNLKELVIRDCWNLAELPAMPISLFKFELRRVGLNSLPVMYHTSSITYPTPSFLESSLRVVEVQFCRRLTSLNGFLQQYNIDFGALERLTIENCENLVQLPSSAFGKFVSLKYLAIKGSPKLVAVDNQRILLPVKLETLSMGNCGQLDVSLLKLASELPILANLYIENSANISWIPSENAFTSLRSLHIHGCDKLIELSLVEHAHGVKLWDNLGFLKISELSIDHLSLLFIKPIRSLRFVRELSIKNCSGIETLPKQWFLQNSSTLEVLHIDDASSLRSLPGTMTRLGALKKLHIQNATLLEKIPVLPTTLTNKVIIGAGGCHLV